MTLPSDEVFKLEVERDTTRFINSNSPLSERAAFLSRTACAPQLECRCCRTVTGAHDCNYRSLAYSALACFTTGMSGSAFFHNSRKLS